MRIPSAQQTGFIALALILVFSGGCANRSGGSNFGLSFAPPEIPAVSSHGLTVVALRGEAKWQPDPASASRPLHSGDILPAGALIKTGDGEVTLAFPHQTGHITLSRHSTVEVTQLWATGDAMFVVAAGRIYGSLSSGSLELLNQRGEELMITPGSTATVPFEFGARLSPKSVELIKQYGGSFELLTDGFEDTYAYDGSPIYYHSPLPSGSTSLPVPEPSSWMLLGTGGLALGWSLSRQKRGV